MQTADLVTDFHSIFGLAVNAPDTQELRILRQNLIDEESEEVCNALGWNEPLEDVAKELADLVYVAYGTAVSLGIDLDEAIRRVHRSNMTKLGPDGEVLRRDDGKILKPPTYQPPDMTGVVHAGRR
ncbi:MazG nucleotide pyrophosphohydrolase domain-containing protein [Amycolatopsis kentuckyensis]|uniref:MazG nucleotide pyrophosphohydrolase domain-containing protein n=1 Tax=Amycolatopsis kentuckyensis TaxID=218823 RepID=UPI000A39EA34|nr:MazG nucleotide pyrophosphohydrolase domain-containing protein [Amycolatopsis kentuckyensis]